MKARPNLIAAVPLFMIFAVTVGRAQSAGAAAAKASPPPAASASASATPSAPVPAAAAATPTGDQPVALQEFDVSGEKEQGYAASESTTGTRIASKIADLPFSVEVVTKDFISDFALFQLDQQLAFVSGFAPIDSGGSGGSTLPVGVQYILRGFQSPTTLVDGFRRVGVVDEMNIDRIEVIKGAAADIYGAISPGGVVDIITKEPTKTPEQELDVDFGRFVPGGYWGDGYANTESMYRVGVSTSGPVGTSGKLFYLVDVADQYTPYGTQFSQNQQAYGNIQLMYEPSDNTAIRLSVEDIDQYAHPRAGTPFIEAPGVYIYQPNKASTLIDGIATPNLGIDGLPAGFNPKGPEGYLHYREKSTTLTLEHRFSDAWTIRASANGFDNKLHSLATNDDYYPLGRGVYTQPVVLLGGQTLEEPQHGGGYQIDSLLKASRWGINNKFLVTNDYYQVSTTRQQYSGSNIEYGLGDPYVALPGQGYPTGFTLPIPENDPSYYSTGLYSYWTKFQDYGLFVSDSLSFLHDRIFVTTGFRYDYVWNQDNNYIFPNPVTGVLGQLDTDYSTHSLTHDLGLLGKVTNNFSLFANESTAFNPQPQLDDNGQPLPANTSTGVEFGAKGAFFNGRLNFTLDHFEINEFNLAQASKNALDQDITILTGLEAGKGYESDVNWQPTPALALIAGYGYTQTKVEDAYALPFLNGEPTPGAPRDNAGVAGRYTIMNGALKGIFFTANERYYSKSLVSLASGTPLTASTTYPLYNYPYMNGYLPFPNLPEGAKITSGTANFDSGRFSIYNAPYAILGVGVGYSYKAARITHTVRVNVSNLLNRYYTFGAAAPGDPCEVIFGYTLKY